MLLKKICLILLLSGGISFFLIPETSGQTSYLLQQEKDQSIIRSGEITTQSLADVTNIIETLLTSYDAKDILVIFDIDMTLTQPVQKAVCSPALKKYISLYRRIMSSLTPEQYDMSSTLLTYLFPQKTVEKDTTHIIKHIQAMAVPCIALTSTLTGDLCFKGGIRFEKERFTKLSSEGIGINFENSFDTKEIIFTEIPLYNGNHPVFYHGILSSNGERGKNRKESVLSAFLRRVNFVPKVIVMVDDKKKNLQETERALKSYDSKIQFIGVEYQGAFDTSFGDVTREDFIDFWENHIHVCA